MLVPVLAVAGAVLKHIQCPGPRCFLRQFWTYADFRGIWESLDKKNEVLEKFSLHFTEIEAAVAAVTACLGMQCVIT